VNARVLNLLVLAAALLALGSALGSEFWGGLIPCELCLAERWPWYGAVPVALTLAVRTPARLERFVAPFWLLVFLGSAGLAFYHVGVEQHWFPGPTACTGGDLRGLTIEELTKRIMATPVIRCDTPQWEVLGVTMAGLNLLASLAMAALSGYAWIRSRSEAS
jgi:disulfide bond formation protein DsbB